MPYLVRYNTESGDEGTLGIFDKAPDTWPLQLALIEEYLDGWIEDGYSCAFITYEEIKVDVIKKLPPPSTSNIKRI